MNFFHNTSSIYVAVEGSKVLIRVTKCVHGFPLENPAPSVLVVDFTSLWIVRNTA